MADRKKYNKSFESQFKDAFPELEFIELSSDRRFVFCKDKYGLLKLNMAWHVRKKNKYTMDSAIDKVSYWRNMMTKINGSKYDYTKSEYIGKGIPVIITCKIHGDFSQRPNDHTSKKCGCPKCANDKNDGNLSIANARKNIERYRRIPVIVYVVKYYNDTESFYKVGITRLRFKVRTRLIPYKYQLIHTYNTNLLHAIFIERSFIKKLSEYKYEPKKWFGGHTECFSNIDKLKL